MTALLLAASCVGALQASLLWEDNYYASSEIVTDGSVAYVATGNPDGVVAVDMSDPRSPTVLGVCGDMAAVGLALSGSMVYAVNGTYGMVCDVSTPSSPVVVGSFALPSECRFDSDCASITAAGTNVYLHGPHEVHVYDAANPASPTLAGAYDSVDVYFDKDSNMAASGGYLYLTSSDSDALQVVDASDPAAPTLVGNYSSVSSPLLASGTTLYSRCNSNTTYHLCVLDISDPTAPTLLVSVDTTGVRAEYMALSGTVLYVSGEDSLGVVDVSDPVSPVVVGSLEYPLTVGRVAALGTTVLCITAGDSMSPHSLYVTDASVPSEPTPIGTYAGSGTADGVYVEGSLAVVCDEDSGALHFYNVSNPSAATMLSVSWGETLYKPVIVGQYAYVGFGRGLLLVNLTDPLDPSIEELTTFEHTYSV